MTVVKISELPQKDALEDGDKVIAWNSANGATSVLLGTAFTAIKEASATSASAAKASENAAKNLASEASSSADSASESASGAALSAEAAKASETNALASANSASASQTQIESDIAQAKLDITTERTAAVSAVEAAQATAISSIQTQGTESVTAVTAAQATSVSAVKAQEAASIQAIEADSVLAGYAKKDELSSLIAAAVAEAKLAAYPVGSIYCSIDSTDPGALFGGTWAAIGAGRALVAAGGGFAVGSEGGADTHTLTVEEMPSHAHTAWTGEAGWHGHAARTDTANLTGSFNPGGLGITASGVCSLGAGKQPSNSGYATDSSIVNINASHMHNVGVDGAGNHTHTVGVGATGGGQAFSVRNPYIAVNMWRRTA